MILVMGYSQGVQAHAGIDKARFVANNEENQGSWNNRFKLSKTVTYAAKKANKGDNILVAQGQYVIESEQDLLYFTIQIFPVLGRFNQLEQYQGAEFRYLFNLNFRCACWIWRATNTIRLSSCSWYKRISKELNETKFTSQGLECFSSTIDATKQINTPCIDASSDGFACNNLSLLAHIPLSDVPKNPSTSNDI